MPIRPLLLPACLALISPGLRAATALPAFEPFLEKYCYGCHGEDKAETGLQLEALARDSRSPEALARWEEAYERVGAREMPPATRRTQPSPEERAAFLTQLERHLLDGAPAPERTVLRRLNRVEYENTVNDLFGVAVSVASLLPEDTSAHGFDNIGEALRTSAVLVERYLEAADVVLDAGLALGPAPERRRWHATMIPQNVRPATPTRLSDGRIRSGVRFLPDDTVVFFNARNRLNVLELFRAPVAGLYRFRVSGYAYQSAGRPLTVGWYAGLFTAGSATSQLIEHFDLPPDTPTEVEFEVRLPARGTIKPVPSGIGYRYLGDTTGYAGPGIAIQWVKVEGPIVDPWPPRGHALMFGDALLGDGTAIDAERALAALAPHVFRRPVARDELAPYVALVRAALDGKKPFAAALRAGVKAMLCAPEFLFLRESPGELDDHALASRLSYFLWSSLPDPALFARAAQGALRAPGGLRAEAERMLADPRARRFVENFTGQWLGLRDIEFTTPNELVYPEFDAELQEAMVREAHAFFTEILAHDLPVRNFLHSDFAMLNGRIAAHYGIPGVQGQHFRRIPLPAGSPRGGVLGLAAVLKVTANGTVTSPIVRGHWVLRNLLGRAVKPPPPGVPAIEPDIRGAVTIREQVARHRADPQCAQCHDRIDPLGLALENFDVIGGWRTHYRVPAPGAQLFEGTPPPGSHLPGAAVAAQGVLPDGRAFADIHELKARLLADPETVARAVAGKLLVYATGADLTFADRRLLDRVLRDTAAGGHGLRSILLALVESPAFRRK